MKRLMILCLFSACGGSGGSEPPDSGIDIADAKDIEADAPDPADFQHDVGPEVAADLPDDGSPATCSSVLSKDQCIAQTGCPAWAECDGVGGCKEPPCWGLCKDFPGTCLPEAMSKTCVKDSDCPDTFVCGGRIGNSPGFCRGRPTDPKDKVCYSDENCPTGLYCAGEVLCPPGKFCQGAEYFGKCVKKPGAGACFEDGDCGAGQACSGAKLCALGSAGCSDTAGLCKQPAAGCKQDEDCPDSGAGAFCTGAYKCPGACTLPERAGECKAAPGYGGCWEDSDCGAKFVCRAALTCPAGSYCGQTATHAGQCGPAPFAGEGVAVAVASAKVVKGVEFNVLLINRGGTPLFIHPCSPYIVRASDGKGGWKDVFVPPIPCIGPEENGVSIAAAAGLVLPVKVASKGTYKVAVPYMVGCDQGTMFEGCTETPTQLEAESEEFSAGE